MKKRFLPRPITDTVTSTHAISMQELYTPRISLVHVSLIFLLLGMTCGLFLSGYFAKLSDKIPSVMRSSFALTFPQPANTGSITLHKIGNTPATVIMAGDSLARGRGSQATHGVLKNIGYYLTTQANKIDPGIAHYQVVSGLAVDGASVEQLNQQLTAHTKTLTKVPNLVLMLSFTNKDMQNFVADAAKVHGGNTLGTFFQIVHILNRDSKHFQYSLVSLRHTLTTLELQREKTIGKKASMQVVILGVPNESYSPTVQKVLKKYHVTYKEFSYVINAFNSDDRQTAVLGNTDHAGISYAFVNLDKIQVSKKRALLELSADAFHPNSRGYQSLTDYIAQDVLLPHKRQLFLAQK